MITPKPKLKHNYGYCEKSNPKIGVEARPILSMKATSAKP